MTEGFQFRNYVGFEVHLPSEKDDILHFCLIVSNSKLKVDSSLSCSSHPQSSCLLHFTFYSQWMAATSVGYSI